MVLKEIKFHFHSLLFVPYFIFFSFAGEHKFRVGGKYSYQYSVCAKGKKCFFVKLDGLRIHKNHFKCMVFLVKITLNHIEYDFERLISKGVCEKV